MKIDGKFMATVLALGLLAALLASVPVLANSPIYAGDGVGYFEPTTKAKPANEALRTGIYGGDQVGFLTPAQEERLCNMSPKDSTSCYAGMQCGPKGQQCAVHSKSQCTS